MPTFGVRALEYNAGANIWSATRIERALDYMAATSLNTLVLNDVFITNRVVYPASLFGGAPKAANVHAHYASIFREVYRYAPRGRSRRFVEIEFLQWVIRRARDRDIAVYINNKEITFPDSVLELHGEVVHGNVICPTHPFWEEFIRSKYEDLFGYLPGLSGMITSPGTGESRVTIAGNRCTCERCAVTDSAEWYRGVILAMHGPAVDHDVELVVRDFVFDRATQQDLAKAWEMLPPDIAVCLKNTPHDYYPTFPDNPRIAEPSARNRWIEFDSMGQYFGWGVAPAVVIEDIRARMRHASDHGVNGVLNRTDWEVLEDHSCFDTPNLLNLDAFAALAVDASAEASDVTIEWLRRTGALTSEDPEVTARVAAWAERTLGRTWKIVAGFLYAHDCVFNDSSSYPVSVEHAFWLGEEKNSLRDWAPERWDALSSDAENVTALLEEKDAALALLDEVVAIVRGGNPGLTDDFYDDLVVRFEVAHRYLLGFWHAMRVSALARHVREHPGRAEAKLRAALPTALDDLNQFCDELDLRQLGDTYPACILLSGDRLRGLCHDAASSIDAS